LAKYLTSFWRSTSGTTKHLISTPNEKLLGRVGQLLLGGVTEIGKTGGEK